MEVVKADPVLDASDSAERIDAILARQPSMLTAEPVTALDVAGALLAARGGRSDTWWLQKMVYVAQAIHLRLNGEALYRDEIQAWRDGPVVRNLYAKHPRAYEITKVSGSDIDRFHRHPTAPATLQVALRRYGDLDGGALKNLTHDDPPWLLTREGLPPEAPSDRVIPVALIRRNSRIAA